MGRCKKAVTTGTRTTNARRAKARRVEMRRRGVSLLEIAVVLVITAILAAIALPKYAAAIARYRLDSAARRICADLALARSHARLTSTTQPVVFNPANATYQLPGIAGLDNSATSTVNLSADPYQVTLSSVDFGGGASQVTFDAYGSPTSTAGGTIVVTSPAGETRTIIVDGYTGIASSQ